MTPIRRQLETRQQPMPDSGSRFFNLAVLRQRSFHPIFSIYRYNDLCRNIFQPHYHQEPYISNDPFHLFF